MLTLRTTAVAAATAMLVAGCSSGAAPPDETSVGTSPAAAASPKNTAAPKSARGDDDSPVESIPWDDVGAGWTLATWTMNPYVPFSPPAAGDSGETTLYLVDPDGNRYAITTFPPRGDGSGPQLVDWSGDGERALISNGDAQPPTAIIVDLQTGEQTTVPNPGTGRFGPRFTLPSGEALLLTGDSNDSQQPPTLERVDLTGKRELLYPTDQLGSPFGGSLLSTPNGTQLVLGSDAGLVMMGNDGAVGETLSNPPGMAGCSPVRWWDGATAATMLVSCSNNQNQAQLWLTPVDGDAPTALTAPNGEVYPTDAWQLPAGTFVQTVSQCGDMVLQKLNTDGTSLPVSVPDTDPKKSIQVIGVSGEDLIVRGFPSCGPGEALIDYDPAANTSTVLLGPPLTDGGVTAALTYPDQE